MATKIAVKSSTSYNAAGQVIGVINYQNAAAGSGASTAAAINSAEAARRQLVSTLQQSSVPEIAALQRMSQDIFVATGKWDTAEQKRLHQQAEQIRLGTNPLYPGSADGSSESRYILGESGSFMPDLSGMPLATIGIGVLLLLMLRR